MHSKVELLLKYFYQEIQFIASFKIHQIGSIWLCLHTKCVRIGITEGI